MQFSYSFSFWHGGAQVAWHLNILYHHTTRRGIIGGWCLVEYERIGFVYCVQFDSQLLIVNEYKNKSAIDKKKALISRLFPVDLDAPCMDLERTFILRIINNVEI